MRHKPKIPPLPAAVHTVLGPIAIELVPVLKDNDGKECPDDLGEFHYMTRAIRIVESLDRVQAHHTIRHEWAHAVLFDSGLHNILPKDLEEQICDIFATALVSELLAR